MVKNTIKEIIILLLMVLAIILILGVLLYDYAPNNKIIPEKVSYTTPESVTNELKSSNEIDTSEVVLSYQIDATDLTNYKKTKDYVAGKSNPFESIIKENVSGGNANQNTNQNMNGNSNGNTTVKNNTTEPSNTQDTNNYSNGYLPNDGIK